MSWLNPGNQDNLKNHSSDYSLLQQQGFQDFSQQRCVGGAGELADDLPFPVDEEFFRYAPDAVADGNFTAFVDTVGIRMSLLLQKQLGVSRVVPQIDADELHAPVAELAVDLRQGRGLVAAGRTPGRPEVHHHDSSSKVCGGDSPAAYEVKGERRRDFPVNIQLDDAVVDREAAASRAGCCRSPNQDCQQRQHRDGDPDGHDDQSPATSQDATAGFRYL